MTDILDYSTLRKEYRSNTWKQRQASEKLSEIEKKINIIKKSNKEWLSTEHLVDIKIFLNVHEAQVYRKCGGGPEFKPNNGVSKFLYKKSNILKWLNTNIHIRRIYLDENIEIIDNKINKINSFKNRKLTSLDLVNLNIFSKLCMISALRNLKGGPPFIVNKSNTRYLYTKRDLMEWFKMCKNIYLHEIKNINLYLQGKNKSQVTQPDLFNKITYDNANICPLDQPACKDYLKKLNCIEIQLLECVHLFKNIFIENESRVS